MATSTTDRAVARARHEPLDERRALAVVVAGGEDLLELVDRHDRRRVIALGGRASAASGCSPGRSSRSRQRSLPGRTPAASAASRPARSADDLPLRKGRRSEQRRADEPGDELGDEPLAPEEQVRVVDLERREALERARDDAAFVGVDSRRAQLDDVVGQVGLRRAQAQAFLPGARGGGAQAPRRRIVRPRARELMHPLRNAAARGGEPLGRRLVAVARVIAGDRAHRVDVEGSSSSVGWAPGSGRTAVATTSTG